MKPLKPSKLDSNKHKQVCISPEFERYTPWHSLHSMYKYLEQTLGSGGMTTRKQLDVYRAAQEAIELYDTNLSTDSDVDWCEDCVYAVMYWYNEIGQKLLDFVMEDLSQ